VDPLFALQTLILGQCFGFPPKFLRSSAAKNSFGFPSFFSFGCFWGYLTPNFSAG